jgi:hypothetical protein
MNRIDEIKARLKAATPGPWSWDFISDKNNGYIVGISFDKNNNQLLGNCDQYRDDDPMMIDDLIYARFIGEHEASTCNYGDPDFIAHAGADIAFLLSEVERLEAENINLQKALDSHIEAYRSDSIEP